MIANQIECYEEFFCVTKAINIALKKFGFSPIDVDELNKSLQLTLPEHLLQQYPFAIASSKQDDCGIELNKENAARLTVMLKKHRLPLSVEYFRMQEVARSEFREWCSDRLESGATVIVGYDYRAAFNKKENIKHVGVIDGVGTPAEGIFLIEPETGKRVLLDEMIFYGAIRAVDGKAWIVHNDAKKD